MPSTGKLRWGIFVHDPDGDMGDGEIVGPFYDGDKAQRRAEAIERRSIAVGWRLEAIVVSLEPGAASLDGIIERQRPRSRVTWT